MALCARLCAGMLEEAQVPSRDLFAGWSEAGVDASKPSIARVYDYWLDGDHNFVVDREFGDAMTRLDPWIPAACRANRAFLQRTVRFIAARGVRQFLDIGSGIPAAGNVHEIAEQVVPGARTVYADRDPAAVAEGAKYSRGQNGRWSFTLTSAIPQRYWPIRTCAPCWT